jgi:serine protease Do
MKLRPNATGAAVLAAAAIAAVSANALSLPAWLHAPSDAPASPARATVPAAPAAATTPALVSLPNYRATVQRYGPAVVGVTVSGARAVANDEGPSMDDDPFFQFFRGLPGRGAPRGAVPFHGQGSGFIVDADGVVLTNAHVVRDAKQVTVRLADRREFSARVLGSDPATDVAVLKIDAKDLPTVALGDPRQVQVGDWVLAIGAPYGFEQTATQGIVSAKGRSLPGDSFVPFIQTDAAVNPGNSGGPLFDAGGRVVGINAQIYSQSGGFQGLAFAIPIDVAMRVGEQIVAKGHVDHARMGVVLQDLSAPLAESFGLKSPDGALVSRVAAGSTAAAAALKPGDVITGLDGQAVHTAGDVSGRVGMAAPGEKLTLTVWRDKAARELKLVLGTAKDEAPPQAAAADGGALGLAVRPLQRQELQRAGIAHGLLVEQAEGAAGAAGIQPGDIVLALNGKPVQDVGQVRSALKAHPRHVALLIQRDGEQIFVPVDLG